MEFRDIEYFAVIAEHGHVGRAAEALGLGQPALSKSLRRLEQSTGAKLFTRTSKGLVLTPAGQALLSRVRQLRVTFDDVAREVADIGHGRSGHLRVGANAGFIEYPLCPAFRRLMCEAPHLTFTVAVETADVLIPALLSGELDLMVVPLAAVHHDGIAHDYLFEDYFSVIASPEHRLAARKRVTVADLAQEKWILSSSGTIASRRLFRAFEDKGLPPPHIVMRTPSLSLRDILVATTNCLGHSSTRMAQAAASYARLVEIGVSELRWTRKIGVAYRREAYVTPAAARLIELLKSTVGSTGGT